MRELLAMWRILRLKERGEREGGGVMFKVLSVAEGRKEMAVADDGSGE